MLEILSSENNEQILPDIEQILLDILRRIFGKYHIVLAKLLKRKAATLLFRGRLEESKNVFLECLQVFKNNTNKRLNTRCLIDLFCRMIKESIHVRVEDAIDVFQYIVSDVELNYTSIHKYGYKMEHNIISGTNLMGILISLFKKCSDVDDIKRTMFQTFVTTVKQFVHLNPKVYLERTLLHINCMVDYHDFMI